MRFSFGGSLTPAQSHIRQGKKDDKRGWLRPSLQGPNGGGGRGTSARTKEWSKA